MPQIYMKHLIPNGDGAFFVERIVSNTDEGIDMQRDARLAAGDWGEASQADFDAQSAAMPAVSEILRNVAEWARIEDLPEDQKQLVRAAIAGDVKLAAAE